MLTQKCFNNTLIKDAVCTWLADKHVVIPNINQTFMLHVHTANLEESNSIKNVKRDKDKNYNTIQNNKSFMRQELQ